MQFAVTLVIISIQLRSTVFPHVSSVNKTSETGVLIFRSSPLTGQPAPADTHKDHANSLRGSEHWGSVCVCVYVCV